MKIIAVDDVKENRYLLQKLLEGYGYAVETASNGIEALEKARASTPPPDMIITDVLMPKMDGFQLCRELKADNELKDVPVLFYSATYTDKKSQELAMSIGAAGYIVKPIEPDEFIKLIKATLEKHERGEIKPVEKPLEEYEYVKLHSERLMQKLEKKMLDLEREITERKQTEEKLARIVDGVNIPAFAINTEHKITHWNTAVESLTGLKREIAVGSDKQWIPFCAKKRPVMADLIVDEAPESKYKEWYGDKYKKSSLIESAYEALDFFLTLGGKWLLFTAAPLCDSEGKIIGAIETLQDITERKLAEEALRESEERYRQLFNSGNDAMFVHPQIDGKPGKFIAANDVACQTLGYTREELLRLSHLDITAPEQLGDVPAISEKLLDQKRNLFETVAVTKDGRNIPFEINTHLFNLNGEPAVLSIARDITGRKAADAALRKSEEEYRSLVESTEDSVYLVDRDCRYLFMNEKHLSLIGMPKDQVIGITYGEFHSEDETEEFAEIVEDVFETGKSVQHEHRSRRGNRYILRTLSPVKDSEGGVTAVTVISKDITERKQIEEERERLLKELEAKSTELERFAYTVSHDLRSPLITIQGFTDMVQTDLAQNELEKAKENLTFIDRAATKMDKLLSATLQLSRIGRMMNPPEDVSFGEIVKDALEQTAEQIKSSDIEIAVADDFPTVHVDRMRIAEVLVNLIVNSINYMDDQPHPKIEIGYRVEGKSKETVFFVRDNGIGIDPGQHEKVFDLFYQVDSSGKKGTGAGLAIVKRIIEVHNGRIWIESEKGKGCTICFTLPVV